MARLLYIRDSSDFVQSVIRRMVRICNKSLYGAPYTTAIVSTGAVLKEKKGLEKLAIEAREDAYDDVMYADADLDNSVKNAFDAWTIYKRKHPTEIAVANLFGAGFSEIIRLPYEQEPTVVDAIATKIETFGNTHELYPLAAELRANTAKVRTAIEAHKDKIRLQKAAEAEVEIAKISVIRAYEVAYLDARKNLGAEAAERLFPKIRSVEKETTPAT